MKWKHVDYNTLKLNKANAFLFEFGNFFHAKETSRKNFCHAQVADFGGWDFCNDTFVTTDEFSVRVTKITSRIGVS